MLEAVYVLWLRDSILTVLITRSRLQYHPAMKRLEGIFNDY